MEHSGVFKVVGVDFTGPIKYRKSPRMEGKPTVCLQPDKSFTSGSLARKLKALDCSLRTPFHYILRQWTNLYQSSTPAWRNSDGQTAASLPGREADHLEVQPYSCTLVGWTVWTACGSLQMCLLQNYRGRNAKLDRVVWSGARGGDPT